MNGRGPSRGASGLVRAAGACVLIAASCAAPPREGPAEEGIALPSTLSRLVQRAESDRARRGGAVALPADWVDGTPEGEGATSTTGEALPGLDETVRALAGELPTEPPALALREEALKRYAAGRAALLAGTADAAMAEFEAAHKADPGAPEPLRDLGEAQILVGRYAEAIASFEKALERDPRSVRALEQVGRHALRTGDVERSARLFSQAWLLLEADADVAERGVVALELGRALAATGRSLAGAEALRIAAEAPSDVASARWADLASLVRQRSDVLRASGDLFSRAGRWREARDAYDNAFRHSEDLTADALTERRVVASLRSGSASGATRALVEACIGRPLGEGVPTRFRASPETLGLLRRVSALGHSGPTLEQALRSAASMLPEDARGRWASDVALALAAAQRPAREGIGTLRARVEAAPEDERALGALLGAAMQESGTEAARVGAGVVSHAPERADEVASALLRAAGSFAEVVRALEELGDLGADEGGRELLLAVVELPVRPERAMERAASAARGVREAWAAESLRARALAKLGRFEDGEEALAGIDAGTAAGRLARARALSAIGRAKEALEELTGDVSGEQHGGLGLLLFAAELAARADAPGTAERLRHRAIAAYPEAARPYESIIAALLTRRPQAREEADEIAQQVRDAAGGLRGVAPWSDTLQALLARDLLAQRQWRDAMTRLQPVLERRAGDRDALAMFLAAAKQAEALGEVASWVGGIAEARPDLSHWLAAYAFVLAETERTAEAVERLESALRERPFDGEVSRALEDLLRTRLGDAARADVLAFERLRYAPPTAETRVERAEALLRAGRESQARAEIEALLASGGLGALEGRLVNIGLSASASLESEAGVSADALAILDALISGLSSAPEALHRRHIIALVRSGAEIERVRAAAALAASRHAALAGDAYLLALDELVRARRPEDALSLVKGAATAVRDPRPSLLASWMLLAVSAHAGEDALEACQAAVRSGRVGEVFEALTQIAPALRTEGPRTADELAYLLASAFGAMGLEDEADLLYTYTLELNPDHAWSNNNLGYRMLTRGERFPEAYWMIVRAFGRLPDDPAVIDSMGWARYLAGIFRDVPAAGVEPAVEGAVTLLQRAADALADRPDPEVYEHLGDALYRAERADDARRAWELALSLTRQLQAQAEASPNIAVDVVTALRERAERLHQRLDALGNNRPAPTAEVLGKGREPPRPADVPAGPVS